MPDSIRHAVSSTRRQWRYRFGLRFLLAIVLLAALFSGWVASEHRRAAERTALVAQLSGVGVRPILEEPTGFGLLVKKVVPGQERALRKRIGGGWFLRPTVFVCMQLEDEKVPYAAERLRRLGTVREFHTQGPRLSPRGISALRSGLPGIDVVPSANRAQHRYLRDQVEHEHLAIEGLELAGLVCVGLVGTLLLLAWPFRGGRRSQVVGTERDGEVSAPPGDASAR